MTCARVNVIHRGQAAKPAGDLGKRATATSWGSSGLLSFGSVQPTWSLPTSHHSRDQCPAFRRTAQLCAWTCRWRGLRALMPAVGAPTDQEQHKHDAVHPRPDGRLLAPRRRCRWRRRVPVLAVPVELVCPLSVRSGYHPGCRRLPHVVPSVSMVFGTLCPLDGLSSRSS
jgi:hypothetical protein